MSKKPCVPNHQITKHLYQFIPIITLVQSMCTKSLHFTNHSIEMGMEYLAQLGELAGGAFTSPEQSLGRRPSLRKHSSRARVGGCRSWGALLLLLLQGRVGRWRLVVRGRVGARPPAEVGSPWEGSAAAGRGERCLLVLLRRGSQGAESRVGRGGTGSRGLGLAGGHGEKSFTRLLPMCARRCVLMRSFYWFSC